MNNPESDIGERQEPQPDEYGCYGNEILDYTDEEMEIYNQAGVDPNDSVELEIGEADHSLDFLDDQDDTTKKSDDYDEYDEGEHVLCAPEANGKNSIDGSGDSLNGIDSYVNSDADTVAETQGKTVVCSKRVIELEEDKEVDEYPEITKLWNEVNAKAEWELSVDYAELRKRFTIVLTEQDDNGKEIKTDVEIEYNPVLEFEPN